MTKNEMLSDTEHHQRWDRFVPLAKALTRVFTIEQLDALCTDLERWVDWDTPPDAPGYDGDAPDGAEILCALINQAWTYASREAIPSTVETVFLP